MKRKAKGNPQNVVKMFVLIADLLGEWSANDEPDMGYVSELTTDLIDHFEDIVASGDSDSFMEFSDGKRKLCIKMDISISEETE